MPQTNWPPATMATQHPDNASAPWWKDSAFISTQDEIEELVLLYKELGVDEYMWDWEGKYVDEAVGEKVYALDSAFFKAHPLGRALHLTFRIPAFRGGQIHHMARAFMNILSLSDLARDIGMPCPPVREMFLPLTVSADQLMSVRRAFTNVCTLHRQIFHQDDDAHEKLASKFQVTPLVEDIDSMFGIRSILEPYWKSLPEELGEGSLKESGLRVFLARSDPALNSGIVPAVLAIKSALSTSYRLAEEMGVSVYPVIGTGSLPFRGSVNPLYTDAFLEQYAGVRTYSIQSAFRYDYPLKDVKKTIELIKREAPKREVQHIESGDAEGLRQMCALFTKHWQRTIEELAESINKVASFVPGRRERLLHIGLFGYSRGVGAVTLPRAISFTAALYSQGIPPELIATGRGLIEARERGWMPLIEKYYPALRDDLRHAGKYVNHENVEIEAKKSETFRDIQKDLAAVEQFLEAPLGPQKPSHMIHRNLTSNIFHRMREEKVDAERITQDIVEAAVIRRSLG